MGEAFTCAFFIPAGLRDAPHWHGADSRICVVRGELKLAYGTRFDRAKAEVFGAGLYLFVPANAIHYDGADVDTLIVGTAIGPWATAYVTPDAPAESAIMG